MSNESKVFLRNKFLQLREKLSREQQVQSSQKVFQTFYQNLQFILPKQYLSVALYAPIKGEVDACLFFSYFQSLKKSILFPRVTESGLKFFLIQTLEELSIGTYGILEPCKESLQLIEPDVVFLPGVAYSKQGHRLGYGKGFYDYFFNNLRKPPLKLGLCYDFQLIETLPYESHDHRVDWIISESQIVESRL